MNRLLRLFAICWMLLLAGCLTPDRLPRVEAELDAYLAEDAPPPVTPPEGVAPELPEPLASQLAGPGSLSLSLEDVVVLALHHNRDLEVEQLNPVIAGTFAEIERGLYDPELFAEGSYTEERASETARSTGSQFSVEGQDVEIAAGVRQRLPTGTTIEGSVEHDRSISNRAPEQQVARFGLTVTQSLLQGFGPAVNLASIRQAELDEVASRYELRGYVEALVAEAEIGYWTFVLAREEIAIFEESLALARKQLADVQERIEVGVVAQTEAAAAQADVALREQALIDARSELAERRLRLLRIIDGGGTGQLQRELAATSEPLVDPAPVEDLTERLALAERARPDLRQAELLYQQRQLETVITRNGLLPRMDVFMTYGLTGYADTWHEAYDNIPNEKRTYDFTVGLELSHFLGNRSAEARHRRARFSHRQAERAIENLRQLIHLDILLAANELERSRQQVEASRTTREFQQETVNAERERFDLGTSTALLVAQAQRDLLASQIAEIEAVIGYQIARVELYLAEGSLLERRGLEIPGTRP